ncbi:MAG: hypothetical protein QGG96_07755 [Candidatus Poseidoniaceae archaeon]|jgi:hypothetical protein|nr:hypothetical protein [Candidatus Poseidoniaceae archaeon]
MAGWRDFLEEESEYQWMSFGAFAIFIIIGAIMIDWSGELSGVTSGSSQGASGLVIDSTSDAFIYDDEDGRWISLRGEVNSANNANCVTEQEGITYFCSGQEGVLFMDVGNGWEPYGLVQDLTVIDLATNGYAMMMIVENGSSTTFSARSLGGETISEISSHDGDMSLTEIIATDEGWLAAGSWRAPTNWQGTSPASSSFYELVVSITWDASTSAPIYDIVHLGGPGVIHTLAATHGGIVAAGQTDAVLIAGDEIKHLDIASMSAAVDSNNDMWFFGNSGSETIAVLTDKGMEIESLPEPLKFTPIHAAANGANVEIHGINAQDESESITIDVDARLAFTSLRGIIDLGFIMISLLILGVMGWNVTDAIRKGEVF